MLTTKEITMAKLWEGRTDGKIDATADAFNASISFDSRLIAEDIRGSIAHATMLGATGIIDDKEAEIICDGLSGILIDVTSGKLSIDPSAEDVHTFVEQTLVARVGDVGKKLHTARSRNDQVALDMRLYTAKEVKKMHALLVRFVRVLTDRAEQYQGTVMCGYTHLQRAQPITFGQHLMAYACMFLRDIQRLENCFDRMMVSPIGSCALAGTSYPIDRNMEAELLGFGSICINSVDGVSDRDYLVELMSDLALVMVHLSRLCEELVLWSSWEFGYITLSDAYTTGSSIMPQKKNADMAELTRGKTGRVVGDLVTLLTVLKGLPLAYNKDMQEDKECAFDAMDTVRMCLEVCIPMVDTMTVHADVMRLAAAKGFINATDLADYLVVKGQPFRTAYHTVGAVVSHCVKTGNTLETLPIETYKQFDPLFEEDLFAVIDLDACVARRTSAGGTSVQSVVAQIATVRKQLAQYK